MTTSAEGITARECLVARTQSLIQDITRRIEEGGEINSDTQDYLLYRSDVLYQHVVRLCSLEGSEDLYTDITSKLREVITIIRNEGENSEESTNYRAYRQRTGNPGRPKVMITQEQLEYFIENAFSAVDIASMLGVSVSTVRRRMGECWCATA